MRHSLRVVRENDDTYTSTIEVTINNEPIISVRSMGNQLAENAVARAAKIFCKKYPDFGVSIQSVEDLK